MKDLIVKIERIVADDSAKLAAYVSKALNERKQLDADVQYTSVITSQGAITHFAFIKFFEFEEDKKP